VPVVAVFDRRRAAGRMERKQLREAQ
jgi:hypothetical protein